MNIKKQIKTLGLIGIITMVLLASLSSFTNSHKLHAIKSNQTHVIPAKEPRVFIIRYWDGNMWALNPIADCVGNGLICSGYYVAGGSTRTPDAILTQAAGIYTAAGYLNNPSINSANVQVGKNSPNDPVKITVTITERSSE